MIDHYRTLGVAATADEAVIRAVYVTLMKRFHPDRSASPETLLRAQAINEAYAVLGDPKRRAAYDDERAGLQPWDRGASLPEPRRRGGASGPAVVMLALAVAGGLYAYWPSLTQVDRRRVPAAPIASTPSRCTALGDPERIRSALIVRLDQAGVLDHAAAGALTASRFELGPATDARDLASPGEIACLATLSITLPAAFLTASGQSKILSELQYSVSRTNPEMGVEVQPDGRLIAALSAIRHQPLARVANPMLERDVTVDVEPQLPRPPALPEPRIPRPVTASVADGAAPRPAPSRIATARASAPKPAVARPAAPERTAGPSEGLGGVDRQTMSFYAQSLRHADGQKRGQLARSHGAFAARLAACGNDSCRRSVYLARNGEISRIMIGR